MNGRFSRQLGQSFPRSWQYSTTLCELIAAGIICAYEGFRELARCCVGRLDLVQLQGFGDDVQLGSAAGGIKVIRVLIIFRTILQDVFRMIHPRAVTPLQIGGRVVPETVRIAVLGLFAAWMGVFGIATFIVALQGELTPLSAATAVATTLNDVGPGLGQVGATESFEIVNPLGRFVLIVCMLLGRLEIFTVVALLSPAFWKR